MSGSAVKARPILFSGPMIRALLSGAKSQTRRIVLAKHFLQPLTEPHNYKVDREVRIDGNLVCGLLDDGRTVVNDAGSGPGLGCPHGQLGDNLWVREKAWYGPQPDRVEYDADFGEDARDSARFCGAKVKPSIFMPRWASRITLQITEVRVERVQDISEKDARREGMDPYPLGTNRKAFIALWNSINDKRGFGWAQNPWCYCISFKRIR